MRALRLLVQFSGSLRVPCIVDSVDHVFVSSILSDSYNLSTPSSLAFPKLQAVEGWGRLMGTSDLDSLSARYLTVGFCIHSHLLPVEASLI